VVVGGEDWRATNSFSKRWTNPGGQHSPVVRAHYELCPITPAGACTTGSRAGANIAAMDGFQVPSPGSYRVRTWLEDEAGNVNGASKSAPVTMRFDNQPPGGANPTQRNGWMNTEEAATYEQFVRLSDDAFVPVSGIKGYSVTRDGSMPDGTIDAPGETINLKVNDLEEGTTTLRARAISGSGVASSTVGTSVVRVDKSPPSVSAAGAPDPGVWSRTAATIELTGTDQAHLSGMAGSPAPSPVEEGAYLEYRVDGGPVQQVRGGSATVVVNGDGRHTLTYQAFDFAGNPSGEKTIQFKVDSTAPSPLAFEALNPNDPRQLSAVVADATSGVADGEIGIRPVGQGDYRPLETRLQNGRLLAYLNDDMPDGAYELQVTATDVAGNRATSTRSTRGEGNMVIRLPLRFNSEMLVVGAEGRKKLCATVKVKRKPTKGKRKVTKGKRKAIKGKATKAKAPKGKRKAGKRTKRKRTKVKRKCVWNKIPSGRTTIPLIHGSGARSVGQVRTKAGVPIAHAQVVVEGRVATGRDGFVTLGRVTANKFGVFRYTVPAGPSRTVRYIYAGNNTIRPSEAQLATKVRAKVRLKPSKRRLRNGKAVIFRGRVFSTPIADGGKAVALQAKVGRKWRTFATARANTKGVFRKRYRFTKTSGVQRYMFRAVVTREVGYPYEPVRSPRVYVRVIGR
jgi:hypothetical protein